MSKYLLLFACPRLAHYLQMKSHKSSITVRRNMSNNVYNQSLGCFYHKSSIIFQPDNSFVIRNERERSSCSRPCVTKLKAFNQTPGWNSSYSLPFHNISLKQCSKDCWHLVEALGSAIWPHLHCILDRQSLEKLNLRFPTSWLDFSQVFACHMSSVILTDIILIIYLFILTVLGTLECFLSKYTNYMHILASGPE